MDKARVSAVAKTGTTSKGNPIYVVVTDKGNYKCFDSKIEQYVEKEVEFTTKETEYNGKKELIMNLQREGGSGGFKKFGKSAEELALMKYDILVRQRTMRESYMKDVIVKMIESGLVKDITPTGMGTWVSTATDQLEKRGTGYVSAHDKPSKSEVSDDEIPF